jgi:hypothetical protein
MVEIDEIILHSRPNRYRTQQFLQNLYRIGKANCIVPGPFGITFGAGFTGNNGTGIPYTTHSTCGR